MGGSAATGRRGSPHERAPSRRRSLADLRRRQRPVGRAGPGRSSCPPAAATVALGVLDDIERPVRPRVRRGQRRPPRRRLRRRSPRRRRPSRATIDQSPVTASAGPWLVDLGGIRFEGRRPPATASCPAGRRPTGRSTRSRSWRGDGGRGRASSSSTRTRRLFGWAVGTASGSSRAGDVRREVKDPGPVRGVRVKPGAAGRAGVGHTGRLIASRRRDRGSASSTPDVEGWLISGESSRVSVGSMTRAEMLYRVDPIGRQPT